MREKRKIVDTTLRDGEQQAGIALRPEEKLEIALLLDAIGVHEIEAGTPSLGESEISCLKAVMKRKKQAQISVWTRANTEDIQQATCCKPDLIHIGTPISYIQIYTKLKKNKVWIQRNLIDCIEVAHNQGIEVTIGFEDASRADMGYVISTAKLVSKLGVKIIRIADTVGVLTPSRTRSMIQELMNQVDIEVEIHVHNDLGMAVANSIEGLKAGAGYVDCTLGGLGERTGNCNFYDLVHATERYFDFGINKGHIKKVEQRLGEILSRSQFA